MLGHLVITGWFLGPLGHDSEDYKSFFEGLRNSLENAIVMCPDHYTWGTLWRSFTIDGTCCISEWKLLLVGTICGFQKLLTEIAEMLRLLSFKREQSGEKSGFPCRAKSWAWENQKIPKGPKIKSKHYFAHFSLKSC